jgi:S-adenosylmethionine synthetase
MSDLKLFTSESVTEGHPDKVADQVSDAVLDAVLAADPDPTTARVACETLVSTGFVVVTGEISTNSYVDIASVARRTIIDIGYDSPNAGFDGNTCGVFVAIDEQSSDIAGGVDNAYESRDGDGADELDALGAGDQGMMFGYACHETDALMPMPIHLAHRLAERLAEVRRDGTLGYLRADGKTQVTVEYDQGRPVRVARVLISTQHAPEADDNDELVDTYGGMARHGGGAFSGKDATKVDRSAAYAARWVAKNVVAAGLAQRAELQVAYAIGMAQPVSVGLTTFGTEAADPDAILDAVHEVFDLRPAAIIRDLGLRRPIFAPTAAYGHFGRSAVDFPWEATDRADELRRLVL